MSDDRLELPLFDPPERDSREELDALFDEPAPPPVADEPIVVEMLDLPEPPEVTAETVTASPEPRRPGRPAERPAAGLAARLAAGLVDLLVHVALGGILIGGSAILGAPVGWHHAVPLGFVALVFSFVYYVVPLVFWGRTPGMAVAGLRVRSLDDRPLSLPQATKHWLALLLTAATGGLGVLLALSGRSLADRLSGSQTLQH